MCARYSRYVGIGTVCKAARLSSLSLSLSLSSALLSSGLAMSSTCVPRTIGCGCMFPMLLTLATMMVFGLWSFDSRWFVVDSLADCVFILFVLLWISLLSVHQAYCSHSSVWRMFEPDEMWYVGGPSCRAAESLLVDASSGGHDCSCGSLLGVLVVRFCESSITVRNICPVARPGFVELFCSMIVDTPISLTSFAAVLSPPCSVNDWWPSVIVVLGVSLTTCSWHFLGQISCGTATLSIFQVDSIGLLLFVWWRGVMSGVSLPVANWVLSVWTSCPSSSWPTMFDSITLMLWCFVFPSHVVAV